MTKQNKLIVGVVAVLVVYYFYDRNKKMKTVSDLKAGAEVKPDFRNQQILDQLESGDIRPAKTGGIKPAPMSIVKPEKVEQILF
jgi:hypothetical protein